MEYQKPEPTESQNPLELLKQQVQEQLVRDENDQAEELLFSFKSRASGKVSTLALDQAIQICGQHIADESEESMADVLEMLQEMYDYNRELLHSSPEEHEESIKNGQAVLARYALAASQE